MIEDTKDAPGLDYDSRDRVEDTEQLNNVTESKANDIYPKEGSYFDKTKDKISEIDLNQILGYSVSVESEVVRSKNKSTRPDFQISEPRNILVVINTEYERWIIENIDPEIILVELANHVKSSIPPLGVTPIELLTIAMEIGRNAVLFEQSKNRTKQ